MREVFIPNDGPLKLNRKLVCDNFVSLDHFFVPLNVEPNQPILFFVRFKLSKSTPDPMIDEPIARRYHFGECSLSHFSQIFTVMSKNHQETCETFMTMMMMMMMLLLLLFIPFVPGFQDVSSLFCGNSLFSEVCVAGCPCIVHLGGSRGWEELREALKSRGTSAVSSIWML